MPKFGKLSDECDLELVSQAPEYRNLMNSVNEQSVKLMQNHLLLENIGIEEVNIGNLSLNSSNLLVPILHISNSKYETALDGYKSLNFDDKAPVFKDFSTVYVDYVDQRKMENGVRMPYHFVLKDSLKQILIKAYTKPHEENAKNLADKVISLFTLDRENGKTFNRYHIDYDVMEKPLVEIGEFLFSPWMFLSNIDWFYSFSKSVMKDSNSKRKNRIKFDTKKHEENIAEKFSKAGFIVNTETFKNINGGENGDVDIYIEDENTIILIQVKLSFWREKIEDYYNEKMNAETKAIKQLNLAEEYIKSDEKLHKGKKIIKWMVSSSFENLGELENSLWKVNSLELMLTLEQYSFDTLEDLIEFIKSNILHKDLYDSLLEFN